MYAVGFGAFLKIPWEKKKHNFCSQNLKNRKNRTTRLRSDSDLGDVRAAAAAARFYGRRRRLLGTFGQWFRISRTAPTWNDAERISDTASHAAGEHKFRTLARRTAADTYGERSEFGLLDFFFLRDFIVFPP